MYDLFDESCPKCGAIDECYYWIIEQDETYTTEIHSRVCYGCHVQHCEVFEAVVYA